MKAIDRQHFLALEKLQKQIEKDKTSGGSKKLYFVELDERYEIRPEQATEFGMFYEAYGIWFAGSMGATILKRCGYLHAFVSFKPDKIEEGGPSALIAYEVPCQLYTWKSQGYIRGMILATDDKTETHAIASKLINEKPWSFEPIFATVSHKVPLHLAPHLNFVRTIKPQTGWSTPSPTKG